jgi:hypothetical protein
MSSSLPSSLFSLVNESKSVGVSPYYGLILSMCVLSGCEVANFCRTMLTGSGCRTTLYGCVKYLSHFGSSSNVFWSAKPYPCCWGVVEFFLCRHLTLRRRYPGKWLVFHHSQYCS